MTYYNAIALGLYLGGVPIVIWGTRTNGAGKPTAIMLGLTYPLAYAVTLMAQATRFMR